MYVRLLKTSFLVFIERTIMKTLFASVIGMLAIIVLREVQPWLMDSEEEIYKKFVENFLLEEGAPQFILTDRGTEFKNEILRNLMEMLKIRLRFTPSYLIRYHHFDEFRSISFKMGGGDLE